MSDKAIRAAKLTAAGLLDKARARTAVTRAGGQIAPSKYLPNVPRQVHADGGRENGSEGMKLYRGTNDSGERITGGIGEGLLFGTPHEDVARLYGDQISQFELPSHAKVLTEGTGEFSQVTGRKKGPLLRNLRQGENLRDAANEAIARAKEAGYDAVHFNSMRDMGVAVLNPHIVVKKADGGSVTDSDEFRNWFGNSVTHTDGEPHVFYTGTSKDKDFTSFNMGRHGAWFVRDPAVASQYAEENDSMGHKYEGGKYVRVNTASRVIPAYVKAENPYTGELPEEALSANYKASQSNWFDTLRRKGHDAWIPASQNGNLVVALREPQQIKSIFNNGKFDPKQKHMNKADGGGISDPRAAFMQGNHPDVPEALYHGSAPRIATKGWTQEVDEEQTQKNRDAQDFRTFRPSEHGNYGPGIYLSDSPKTASDYAQGIRADQKEEMPYGQVMKMHVSMKQPFTDDVLRHPAWVDYIKREIKQGLWLGGISAEDRKNAADLVANLDNGTARVRDLFLTDTPEGTMVNQFGQHNIHKTIRNSGFDGIIAHRPDGTKEYVAFKPEQVKSATGNQGTFDPNDPDMTKKDGGSVTTQSKDGSGIFGEGAMIHRYVHPETGSYIEVLERRNGPASVLGLEVPEEHRGKGIGQMLQAEAMSRHPALMGQVSSKAAATTAYRLGRRPYSAPDASLDDVFSAIDRDSSVNMLTPQAQPKKDGGRIHANKGGSMGARADFLEGNHPEVPSVVYHSTKGDFHEFRPMSHFGTMQSAHDRYSPDLNLSQGMSVIPAHISMKNPLDVGEEGHWQNNRQTVRQAADVMFKSENPSKEYLRAAEKLYDLAHNPFIKMPDLEQQAAQALREAGHDGIIYTNMIEDPGSRSFVTLGPEQVKSSIGNQGTFDPTNPNMTKKDGGEVDGIDAFHSSPHDFDQFDIAHLGTGEGAQAYGHGLYFSANPKVSDRGGQYWNQFMNKMKSGAERSAAATLKGQKWDRDAAVSQLRSNAEYHEDRGSGRYGDGSDVEEGHRLLAQEYRDAADHIASGKIAGPRTYRVKLNIKPHELIDWDKPLSEQHPNVQAVLGTGSETAGSKLGRSNNNPMHAGDIVGKDRATRKELSEHLMSKGIKGIRYLDAGSRDMTDGDPTYNYVTFNHDPVKVVDKYEYGGTVEKSGGGPMGDDDDKPVNLVVASAMRRFNQNSAGPTPEAEGVFSRLAARQSAAADAHEAAINDGVFDNVQIGDVFKYKLHDGYVPMKVMDHGMVPVERWGGINPPKYVYNGHYPVAEMKDMDASTERRKYPIELLEDRDRYDFISGKPRAVKRAGGAVDDMYDRIKRGDGGRLNLYSKAARIISGMKDQPMQVADIVKYALGKGAKKTEMAHVDLPPGKATPKQVIDHIEFMQPSIGVITRGGQSFRYGSGDEYSREHDRLLDAGQYDQAENLMQEWETFEGQSGGWSRPLYAKYQLPGGDNYREHILTLNNHEGQTYNAKDHWGKLANPLAHIRMSDRIINGKKILHIEELQSDWNNDARKRGFRTGTEKKDYDDYVAGLRQKAIENFDASDATPMIKRAVRDKFRSMDPHTLAMKMGAQAEHRDMYIKSQPDYMGVPRAPYINPDRDDASEVAMKHILTEAAKGGYDGIAFTPDEAQEERWPKTKFKGIYNKKLPGMAQTLVQQHDPETDPDDMTHLQGWAVPMIPLSEKARGSIMQNGFTSFKRGGAVGYEDGGALPPAENAQKTQVANTLPTFLKAKDILDDHMPQGKSLDYGAGLGYSRNYGFDTYDPFPRNHYQPTYGSPTDIPDGSYHRLTCLNVLNVVPRNVRDDIVRHIGRVLAPSGHAVITTRGRDVLTAKGRAGPEPMSVITGINTYQKGFTSQELREYLAQTLGDEYEVKPMKIGPAGAIVRKKGQAQTMKRGGAVDDALALTRRFTKDGQHVTMRLKPKGE